MASPSTPPNFMSLPKIQSRVKSSIGSKPVGETKTSLSSFFINFWQCSAFSMNPASNLYPKTLLKIII